MRRQGARAGAQTVRVVRALRAFVLAALAVTLACAGYGRQREPATVLLLTDFGIRDGAVAVCKGVMLGIEPRLRVVDVTHEVPPYDVETAAEVLEQVMPFYPPGTVTRYRNGLFVAFHGSLFHEPLEPRGYSVSFVPFSGTAPSGEAETFAKAGFAVVGVAARPSGLAEGPDGSLYVTDDSRGKVWRVRWRGEGK